MRDTDNEAMIRKILPSLLFVALIFTLDRVSKYFILELSKPLNELNIQVTSFLNFNLIWNKGIAFGLLSFEESFVYNATTLVIILVSLVVLIMVIRTNGFVRYSFISIFGGSLGNLFDRIYYTAVPDFIDFHINGFHWFIFNVADIFITTGVICLIYAEIFFNKEKNDKTL